MKTKTSIKTETSVARRTSPTPIATRLRIAWGASLLLLPLAPPAVAQAQFNYTTTNGTVTITQYTGSGGAVVIPGTINGLPVAGLGSYWATQYTGGVGWSDSSWAEVGAFQGSSVTSVAIPSTLTNIPAGALAGCTNLTAITVDAANPAYSSVEGVLFDKSQAVLVQCPGAIAGTYTIPGTVTSLGANAFDGCANLTGVIMPISVTNLGEFAFLDCASLTEVTIGGGVISIGDAAFEGCHGLTNVAISGSVTSIEYFAFSYCSSLAAFTVSALNPAYSSVDGVLFDKSQTTLVEYPWGRAGAYTVPSTATSIGAGAFETSTNLSSVTMGNNVTNIGDAVFNQCTSLTNVILGNGIASIGESAFSGCFGLADITLPASVTSIGNWAFDSCPRLRGVYFNGNAPSPSTDVTVFGGQFFAAVYHLPGTTGWGSTFDGLPTVLWNPQVQTSRAGLGVQTNPFEFTITGATNLVVVVQASTSLASPTWLPLQTIALTGGSFYFTDPQWTNYPSRFYRLSRP